MSQTPIFNPSVLNELNAELGPENTAEVLNTFLADTARKMSVIASAEASRSVIKRESHSIKSSAFSSLSTLALKMGVSLMRSAFRVRRVPSIAATPHSAGPW